MAGNMKKRTAIARILAFVLGLGLALVGGCTLPASGPDDSEAAPVAPDNLTATVQSDTVVDLTWTDQADNEEGFAVEWAASGDFAAPGSDNCLADATSCVVTGLNPSSLYFFRVRAYNAAGSSAWVEASAQTDDPAPTAPAAPTDLQAVAVSDGEVELSWSDNSDNEQSFVLQYSLSSAFATFNTWSVGAGVTTSSIGGLNDDTTYYFRVKAVNSIGDSAWSNTAQATTPETFAGSFSINSGEAYATSTSVVLTSSVTGAVEMRFRNAGQSWSVWETYGGTKAWLLPSGDGTKTVEAEYRNALGNLLARSDSIVLDTVAPAVSSFTVNGGDAYTTTVNVTLNSSVTGAATMRFRNGGSSTWSSWYDYSTAIVWALPAGDGTKTVYAEFRDVAGNVSAVTDTIVLDTTPPTVSSFSINDGAADTCTASVVLNNNVTGASLMRFRNATTAAWSSWYSWSSTRAWTIATAENTIQTVYAEFRDPAGNVRATSDGILYDAIRRVRVTPVQLWITNDGNDSGPGRFIWDFCGRNYADPSASNAYTDFTVHEQTTGLFLDTNSIVPLDGGVVVALQRTEGEYFTLHFYLHYDMGIGYQSTLASESFYFDDWGISTTTKYLYAHDTEAGGYMIYRIDQVD